MIYKQIKLDDKFHDFMMENIYEAKSFAKSHPERICFITVAFPETEDSSYPDISVILNYQPNPNISQKLKDSLTEERKSYINSMKLLNPELKDYYPEGDEPYNWEWSCYGSESIGLSLEQYKRLETAWRALDRDNKIDDILS